MNNAQWFARVGGRKGMWVVVLAGRVMAGMVVAGVLWVGPWVSRVVAQAAPAGQVPPPPLPPLPPAPPTSPVSQTVPRRYTLPKLPAAPLPPAGITSPAAVSRPATTLPVVQRPGSPGALVQPMPLVFDADVQEATSEPGDTNLVFHFQFTNTVPMQVTVERVHTSCGCTTPRLPPMPWVLEPGTNAAFEVALDLRGKRGQVNKMIYLYTSAGFKALTIRATIPDPSATLSVERTRNLQMAAADRQAVFKGDCARCHATPGQGRAGRELFQAVCGVCHEAEHRAEMVPDLRALRNTPGPDHWRQWITHGKAGTLMPAFAQSDGGPLTREQIDSLVDYLVRRFPPEPPPYLARPGLSTR